MSASACSRRLSGSVRRPRVSSVTTSGSQSFGLRSSYTLSSIDTVLQDTLGPRRSVQESTSHDALGQWSVSTLAGARKASIYATLGRAPPARRALQDDIDAENIAETTFRRHPTDGGLLWRPGPLSSLRSSRHILAQGTTSPLNFGLNLNLSPAQALLLASPQHPQQPRTGGPNSGPGSLLFGLFDCSELESLGQAAEQAQAQAQANTRAPAGSLSGLSPLPPPPPPPPTPLSVPAGNTTLEPCAPQRIKPKASGETSIDASAAAASSSLMSSATSVRSCALSPTPSAMRSAIPPSSIPMPPSASISLVPPSPGGLSTPSLLSPLLSLPSPSVFQSTLHSPGLAPPPSPHPHPAGFTFTPESPIAHARRAPSPARAPPMLLRSTASQHTLAVRLPDGLAPEMVTISAKKGARLAVVADLWHREDDSHYEWEVVFSAADVDMMSVRAVFEADGQLMIHVRRRPVTSGGEGNLPPPLIFSR